MNINEKKYRSIVNRIGLTMIFFTVLFWLGSEAVSSASVAFGNVMTERSAYIASELLDSAFYLFAFMIPVAFFFAISRDIKDTVPMKSDLVLPPETPLLIIAGISAVLIFAYLNQVLTGFIPRIASSENLSEIKPYMIVLNFISVAVVPAFCEEFLFRGMILRNLLPYSGTVAVVGSAVMFGLMHQNLEQIIYTTAAGLVMGYIYYRTGSIWCTVLMHMINNALSLFMSLLPTFTENAVFIAIVIDIAMIFCGILSFAALIVIYRKRKKAVENLCKNGVYGISLQPRTGYAEKKLTCGAAVRSFFTPSVIIFIVLSVLYMILRIFVAFSYADL